MSSENETSPGTTHGPGDVVSQLDPSYFQGHVEEEEAAHIGVKLIEAAEKVYGRYSRWFILLGISLVSYTFSLDDETTSNYLPFAASAYNKHSAISTIQVAQSVISACGQPVIAKFADVRSRAQAYILALVFYTLGYIMVASAHGVGFLGAGLILHAIGDAGLLFLTGVVISDMTTLKWRGTVGALISSPVIINAFIGSNVATQVMEYCGWRWGYGMFAILISAALAPLVVTLLWAERKAKQMGLVLKVTATNDSLLYKAWIFCQQLDIVGMVLMSMSVALILLPLTLAIDGQHGWHDPSIIALIVSGCVLLPMTAFWEIKFATRPILAHRILKNRTVVFAVAIEFFDNFSHSLTGTYLYSFILVTRPWSLLEKAYFNQTQSVAIIASAITCGLALRWIHRFKSLLIVSLCIRLLGVALMIHARGASRSAAEIVWTQILQGIGSGFAFISCPVGSSAAVSHFDLAITLAMITLWRNIGAAVGSAVAGAIWTNMMPEKLAEHLPYVNATYRAELFASITVATALPYDDSIRQGVINAYDDVMKILAIAGTCIVAIALALSFFIPLWYLGDTQNCVDTADLNDEPAAPLPANVTTDEESSGNEKTGSA